MKDLHARKPINKTAARVLAAGERYEPNLKIGNQHDSELPIPTAPVPAVVKDLTGTVFGRLTVIGYHSAKKCKGKNTRHKWVVRCVCGNYSVRQSQSITNPKSDQYDACDRCIHFRSVKWKYNNS